jgi:hypothetical protein
MAESLGEEAVAESRGRVLAESQSKVHPLNSRRLSTQHIQSLAQGLGISPDIPVGELRLIIEGKLVQNP